MNEPDSTLLNGKSLLFVWTHVLFAYFLRFLLLVMNLHMNCNLIHCSLKSVLVRLLIFFAE